MSPEELRDEFNAGMAGTWIWEKKDGFKVCFSADGASGSMRNEWMVSTKDQTLPANRFANSDMSSITGLKRTAKAKSSLQDINMRMKARFLRTDIRRETPSI